MRLPFSYLHLHSHEANRSEPHTYMFTHTNGERKLISNRKVPITPVLSRLGPHLHPLLTSPSQRSELTHNHSPPRTAAFQDSDVSGVQFKMAQNENVESCCTKPSPQARQARPWYVHSGSSQAHLREDTSDSRDTDAIPIANLQTAVIISTSSKEKKRRDDEPPYGR